MFLAGGGGGGWKEGGGHSETNQSLSQRGLSFCAKRCHAHTRAAQSTLSRRTDIEALGKHGDRNAQDTGSLHCLTLVP